MSLKENAESVGFHTMRASIIKWWCFVPCYMAIDVYVCETGAKRSGVESFMNTEGATNEVEGVKLIMDSSCFLI